MKVDEAMEVLKSEPRPRLGPFFAARVTQRAQASRPGRRSPWLVAYWLALTLFAATLLLPTAFGVPIAIATAAAIAFPERLRTIAAVLVGGTDWR